MKEDFESGDQELYPPKLDCKDLRSYTAQEIREQMRQSVRLAQNGDLDEMWALADYYSFGCEKLNLPRNFKKAIYWYNRAAEYKSEYMGDALWLLAHCYLRARGKSKDGKKAFQMLEALAEIDCSNEFTAKAAISLAYCYNKGIGTEKNPKKAFAIWEEYAEKSNPTACLNLGVTYFPSKYSKKDYEKAFYWTKKAADLNSKNALNNLGWCFENGYGTEKDIEKAVEYYKEAESYGNRVAKNNLKRLKKKALSETTKYD